MATKKGMSDPTAEALRRTPCAQAAGGPEREQVEDGAKRPPNSAGAEALPPAAAHPRGDGRNES